MEKIDTYWKFDIERFIKDYPDNRAKMEDLKESLKEVGQTKSPNYSAPARTPHRGDSVSGAVQKISDIEAQITQYAEIVNLYEQAYNRLTDGEKMIIRYFFHEPGQISSHVRFLANTLTVARSEVYRCRRRAVAKMLKVIGL